MHFFTGIPLTAPPFARAANCWRIAGRFYAIHINEGEITMKTGFLTVAAVAVAGLMLAGTAPAANAASVPAAKSTIGTVESGLTLVKKPGCKPGGKFSGNKSGGKFSGKSGGKFSGHHGRRGHHGHGHGRNVVPFLVIEGILDAASEDR
jgi:hypothetical protein